MRDDERERRQADLFYADLMGRPRRRRRRRAVGEGAESAPCPCAAAEDAPCGCGAHEDESAPWEAAPLASSIDPGRLFDGVVHRGQSASALMAGEDAEDAEWETLARPGEDVAPHLLTRGALVVQRALGEGHLATTAVLGEDVMVESLYGPGGRLRPDVLVLGHRARLAPPAGAEWMEDAEERPFAEWPEDAGGSEGMLTSLGRLLSPFTRAGHFPGRRSDARGGHAFMETIRGENAPGKSWVTREDAMVAELVAGNMPDALLKWVEIDVAFTDKTRSLSGTVKVLPDYLAVGKDDDFVHVPLDPVSAQKVADAFDVMLPTARICHAIYESAASRKIPALNRDYYNPDAARKIAKPGRAQTSTAAYLEHSEAIQEKMKAAGIAVGTLVAGHKKDVVIARRLHDNPQKIAFQGFYDAKGFPFEPCYENPQHAPQPGCAKDTPTVAHERRFADYAQGVRLVHPWMTVNGESRKVADVLADPKLAPLISSEGIIVPPRIPNTGTAAEAEEHFDDGFEVEDAGESISWSEAAGAPAVVIEAASSGLGTERTTSPIATTSPQRQMNEVLDRELILFAQARVMADWIDRKFSATLAQAFADTALMQRLDVSRDAALLDRLRPFPRRQLPDRRGQLFTTDARQQELLQPPASAAALLPIFDVLHHYGVVLLPPDARNPFASPSVVASITRVEAKLTRERFDAGTAAVEKQAAQWKKDVASKPGFHFCVDRTLIPPAWSAGTTGPKLEVAAPVVELLGRVRALNAGWRAGTYPHHWWNDFSVDVFVAAGLEQSGFWERSKMRAFFRALNTACEQGGGAGPFAWKGIYNDAGLAQEMDGLFGAGRVLHGVDGHGPGPRMHVHLDVRPLSVPLDATTGFWLDGPRVVLAPPPVRAAAPVPQPQPIRP